MTKRGKILRDTSLGAGLLVVENEQYPFTLEGMWKSDIPPTAGMRVDVEFDAAGQVATVRSVGDAQVTKEHAEAALAAAKQQGAVVLSGAVARFGAGNLIALAVLLIGWFFLSAINVTTPVGSISFTFWHLLGLINAKNAFEGVLQGGGLVDSSAGLYGFLALISIVGPFVHYVWKDKRAYLGGLLPLLFMMLVGLLAHSSYNSALGGTGADANNPFMQQMRDELSKAISIGFGVYLSALASLYFAGMAVKDFLGTPKI